MIDMIRRSEGSIFPGEVIANAGGTELGIAMDTQSHEDLLAADFDRETVGALTLQLKDCCSEQVPRRYNVVDTSHASVSSGGLKPEIQRSVSVYSQRVSGALNGHTTLSYPRHGGL